MRSLLVVTMLGALIAFFTVPPPNNRGERTSRPLRADETSAPHALQTNPADEAAFAKVVESALDSNSPSRFALWQAAQQQVALLDPNRPSAASSFIRSGFFHWTELGDADRRSVLAAVEPLLHGQSFFDAMAPAIFQLTGDFKLLRRANPGTEGALGRLQMMAVTNGFFADYRLFREQSRKRRLDTFEMTRRSATQAELLDLVDLPPSTADQPLLQGIIDELRQRPATADKPEPRRADALIGYALDHDLQRLDGLEGVSAAASDPERARLALRLGQFARADQIEAASTVTDRDAWHRYDVERALAEMRRHDSLAALKYLEKAGDAPDTTAANEEMQRMAGNSREAAAVHAALVARANKVERWIGGCGPDVCERARGTLWSEGGAFAVKLAPVQTDNVPPYAEVYADDALIGEGTVAPSLIAQTSLLRGIHRVDVRLANPMTRNSLRRRIRIE